MAKVREINTKSGLAEEDIIRQMNLRLTTSTAYDIALSAARAAKAATTKVEAIMQSDIEPSIRNPDVNRLRPK